MRVLLIFLFTFCSFSGYSNISNDIGTITGKWEMNMKTRSNIQDNLINISFKKGTYFGKNSDGGNFKITIEEKNVYWTQSFQKTSGTVMIKSTGTIQPSGNEIKGQSIFLNGPMKGKRVLWTMRKK